MNMLRLFPFLIVMCCLGCGAAESTQEADDLAGLEDNGGEEPGDDLGDILTMTPNDAVGCSADNFVVGDTRPCVHAVFPQAAFWQQGADNTARRIIDVTRPPFNARGDGQSDDTSAIRAAYTYVLDQIRAEGWEGGDGFDPNSNRPSFIIYFPNGTYLVSNTIIYNGPTRMHPVGIAEEVAWVRFVGESRDGAIIRLKPSSPDFAEGRPMRPVLSFGNIDFNNIQTKNVVRTLTIRVGSGNPAAIGIKFGGANSSEIRDVAIISEDPEHRGAIGLDNSIGTVLSYQRDVLIDGFDRGVRFDPYHFTHVAMEHLTLRNQRVVGVEVNEGTAAIRAMVSNNDVPAVRLTGPGGHLVLLNSLLTGGDADRQAIQIIEGHLFARQVNVVGYGRTLRHDDVTVPTGRVAEYVSDPVITRPNSGADVSLNLPVREVPRFAWAPPETWARPATPGNGVADATRAIRDAIATNASTVYLPGFEYRVEDTIDVPCSVRRIQGLFTTISGSADPKFRVAEDCDAALLVEDLDFSGWGLGLEQVTGRTLVLNQVSTQNRLYENTAAVGVRPRVFMTGVTGLRSTAPFQRVQAFIRAGDGESPGDQLVADNADVWVMVMKTEKAGTAFTARNGARLEVLGSLMNQYSQQGADSWPGSVAILNENAQVSVVAYTNGPNQNVGYTTLIRDQQGGSTFNVPWGSPLVVPRETRMHQGIIPLYVSY